MTKTGGRSPKKGAAAAALARQYMEEGAFGMSAPEYVLRAAADRLELAATACLSPNLAAPRLISATGPRLSQSRDYHVAEMSGQSEISHLKAALQLGKAEKVFTIDEATEKVLTVSADFILTSHLPPACPSCCLLARSAALPLRSRNPDLARKLPLNR